MERELLIIVKLKVALPFATVDAHFFVNECDFLDIHSVSMVHKMIEEDEEPAACCPGRCNCLFCPMLVQSHSTTSIDANVASKHNSLTYLHRGNGFGCSWHWAQHLSFSNLLFRKQISRSLMLRDKLLALLFELAKMRQVLNGKMNECIFCGHALDQKRTLPMTDSTLGTGLPRWCRGVGGLWPSQFTKSSRDCKYNSACSPVV
jgi:hypothetical protein